MELGSDYLVLGLSIMLVSDFLRIPNVSDAYLETDFLWQAIIEHL